MPDNSDITYDLPLDWTREDLKEAPAQDFLFHWAPRNARDSITKQGLTVAPQPQLDGLSAVYLTADPKEWDSDAFSDSELWLIDVCGLKLFFDPEMLAYGKDFLCREEIPANKVILHSEWKRIYG